MNLEYFTTNNTSDISVLNNTTLNKLIPPEQNGRKITDDNLKCNSVDEEWVISILMKSVLMGIFA